MRDLIQIAPQVARGKFTEDLWDDKNYIAEEKLDGERFKMHITRDSGVRFDSRTISKKTDKFTERTGNVPHLVNSPDVRHLAGSVFDGEIKFGDDSMSTSTIMGCLPEEAVKRQREAGKWVNYYIFDVLFYKGEDVRNFPWTYRRDIILREWPRLSLTEHFKLPALRAYDKKKFCGDIFAQGGEGVILKNIHALYTDKKGWVKVKAVATFDVVVMGYEEATPETIKKGDTDATISRLAANGWVGALVFGQYVDGKLKKFGRCSGMPDDIRADFSNNKEARLGTVISIEAQSRIPKTGYFRHPRFLMLRPDKPWFDCTYREDES